MTLHARPSPDFPRDMASWGAESPLTRHVPEAQSPGRVAAHTALYVAIQGVQDVRRRRQYIQSLSSDADGLTAFAVVQHLGGRTWEAVFFLTLPPSFLLPLSLLPSPFLHF